MKSQRPKRPGWFREHSLFVLIPAILVAAATAVVFRYLARAGLPRKIVMTAGSPGGAYLAYAERYRELLAREGIELEVRPSEGALQNLERLKDPKSGVDIGFVQGSAAAGVDVSGLVSLGALYYEPLWMFARADVRIDGVRSLHGKRLAIGAPGSGTRKVVTELAAAAGVNESDAKLLDLGGTAAADALRRGKADVAFFFAGGSAPLIQELLHARGVRLLDFPRADAYPIHFPLLSVVRLPAGGIDLAEDLPPRDIKLVADVALLVARESLHPAAIGPLLEIATKVHGGPGLFERAGEFPAPRADDIPLSEDAVRYYKSGLPFLYRHLPFWLAGLTTRVALLLIPLVGLTLPLMKVLPPLYQWRMRSRIYRWYRDLMALEAEILRDPDPARQPEYLDRLSWIGRQLDNVNPPLSIAQERYAFRMHIQTVRSRIEEIGASGNPRNGSTGN